MNYPKKYIPTILSLKDRKKQKEELDASTKAYKKKRYLTRKKVKSFNNKESKHIKRAKKLYGVKTIKPSKLLSKKTKCSQSALRAIVKKGRGAYYSSGSRPNQTAHSWAYARLASAISGGPASKVDYNILKKGCKKKSKAIFLAKKEKNKN